MKTTFAGSLVARGQLSATSENCIAIQFSMEKLEQIIFVSGHKAAISLTYRGGGLQLFGLTHSLVEEVECF